ncbi:MAG: hypothetical protein LUF00_08280, partial [Lachnospiraceae bacterium]|nr:hypothetical protein [Lachnospiraceae bacterium]
MKKQIQFSPAYILMQNVGFIKNYLTNLFIIFHRIFAVFLSLFYILPAVVKHFGGAVKKQPQTAGDSLIRTT